ncbi:S-adenosyl-L-methionine-dependent methyltransferase [Ilyonectria robusta]|uniref:S-adenosyl-L-methionine-dependent methyltransferase n=1 Tax=Ilyonectria robusta TaxID=1079257 RepID=UPI001E8E5F9E|nr:S-adenosyl-L-methionine-dependent methyltransferase [Ilyonectria robusta]KAH8665601.1 S-adenosyl-L-methionine-dependent methyltransferase [Ilyonectria robusta]
MVMTASNLPADSSLQVGSDANDSPPFSDIDEKVLGKPAIKGTPIKHHVVSHSPSPKRWKTFIKAFQHIRNLTPKEVDDFMASYEIYSLDWTDEEQMIAAFGPNYQQHVGDCLRAYYSVLNHLCSLGDVEKMYIPPLMDKKASVLDNQLLNEEAVAREVQLGPGMKVLDLGCGRGRVAAYMTNISGAKIVGLNIDSNQISQARELNDALGFDNQFVVHDQNDLPLPFPDESFDAFYEIQALSLCKDPSLLFRDICRVLKPGARFLLLDWVSLPAYNPMDPKHAGLMRRVKPLIGAVGTPTPASFSKALEDAGFAVTKSDNPSIGGLQAPLIDKVDIYFRGLRRVIHGLVKLHTLPAHFKTLFDRLCLDGQAFVEMDNLRLITTTWRIVAQKPAVAM